MSEHEPTAPTSRQLAILSLMAEGLSRKQIADRLFVETVTVRTHLNDLYKRIGIAGCGNPGWRAVALYAGGAWACSTSR